MSNKVLKKKWYTNKWYKKKKYQHRCFTDKWYKNKWYRQQKNCDLLISLQSPSFIEFINNKLHAYTSERESLFQHFVQTALQNLILINKLRQSTNQSVVMNQEIIQKLAFI